MLASNPNNLLQLPHSVLSVLELINRLPYRSYIVGGFIRDHFLGREDRPDIDLATSGDGFQLARHLHGELPGLTSFAPLDPVNGCGRLIVRDQQESIIDIASMKAPSINQDILRRDFTINSMALELRDFLTGGFERLIDPLGGLQDVQNKIVRACSSQTFSDDPLRVMRAYRFKAELDFSLDGMTRNLLEESIERLDDISGERIRDEIHHILSLPTACETIKSMEEAGVISSLFPELTQMKGCLQNRYHSLDVWDHSMACIERLEELLMSLESIFSVWASEVRDYLNTEVCPGRNRLWLIKLACLFHDSGKPGAISVDAKGAIHFYGHEKVSVDIFQRSAERLRMSNKETGLVSNLIAGHMSLFSLTSVKPSRRFIYRITERFHRDLIGLLIIFISDLKSSCGPARSQAQLQMGIDGANSTLRYLLEQPERPIQALINGNEIMDLFNLPQGPLVGKILSAIKKKQALGQIDSREEAVIEAGRLVEKLAP